MHPNHHSYIYYYSSIVISFWSLFASCALQHHSHPAASLRVPPFFFLLLVRYNTIALVPATSAAFSPTSKALACVAVKVAHVYETAFVVCGANIRVEVVFNRTSSRADKTGHGECLVGRAVFVDHVDGEAWPGARCFEAGLGGEACGVEIGAGLTTHVAEGRRWGPWGGSR